MVDEEKTNKESPNRLGILIKGFQNRLTSTEKSNEASSSVFGLGSQSHRLSQEQEKLETDIQKALEELTALKNEWPAQLKKIDSPVKLPAESQQQPPSIGVSSIPRTEKTSEPNVPLGDLPSSTPHFPQSPPKKGIWEKIRSIIG